MKNTDLNSIVGGMAAIPYGFLSTKGVLVANDYLFKNDFEGIKKFYNSLNHLETLTDYLYAGGFITAAATIVTVSAFAAVMTIDSLVALKTGKFLPVARHPIKTFYSFNKEKQEAFENKIKSKDDKLYDEIKLEEH